MGKHACNNARHLLWQFLINERGATAIKYAMLAAGIAVAIIATVAALGTNLNTTFSSVSTALNWPKPAASRRGPAASTIGQLRLGMIAAVSGWGVRWGAFRHQDGLWPLSLGAEAVRLRRGSLFSARHAMAAAREVATTHPFLCHHGCQNLFVGTEKIMDGPLLQRA